MGTDFSIEQIFDETGYPKDNFISDTECLIATFNHPLRLSILELKRLFYKLQPIIENYEKWEKKREIELG